MSNIIYCVYKPYEDEDAEQIFSLDLDTHRLTVYDQDGNFDQVGIAGENEPIFLYPNLYPRISEDEFKILTIK